MTASFEKTRELLGEGVSAIQGEFVVGVKEEAELYRQYQEVELELDRAERIVATVDRNLESIFAPGLSYAEAQRRAYVMAEELDPDRAREAAAHE